MDALLQTVGRLKLAMVGIFVPQKSANATGQGFPLLDSPLPPQEATSIPLVMKFLSKLGISRTFKQTNGVGWGEVTSHRIDKYSLPGEGSPPPVLPQPLPLKGQLCLLPAFLESPGYLSAALPVPYLEPACESHGHHPR